MRCLEQGVATNVEALVQVAEHVVRKIEASSIDGTQGRSKTSATDFHGAQGVIFAACGRWVLVRETFQGSIATLVCIANSCHI
jgi:hypothetical protein